jgi:hypothetical protein
VSADGAKVYVGGLFGFINGQARSRLGAIHAITGALDPSWVPSADAPVTSLVVAPDGNRVFVGGYFSTLSCQSRRATGSLDPVDGSNVDFAAEGNGGGCFDGTFAARQGDDALIWRNDCPRGDPGRRADWIVPLYRSSIGLACQQLQLQRRLP